MKKIRNTSYPYIDPSKYSLNGTSVLITGASKGIGLAIGIGYAKAGASQIALAARSDLTTVAKDVRNAAKAAGRPEPQVLTLQVDITDQKSIEAAAERVEQEFGQLDVLVNNAGYLAKFEPLLETDPVDWWCTWETNIKGVYLMSRAIITLILKSQSELKTVINISSAGGLSLNKGASAYETSKLAIMRFSEFLNADYGDQGLLAYSIHPGGILTEMTKNASETIKQTFLIDTPELPGETIPWLTSQRRNWLAGRYVSCNWDMEELESRKNEIVKGDLLKVRMAVALGH